MLSHLLPRLRRLAVALAVVAAVAGCAPYGGPPPGAFATTDALNVRAGPSDDAPIVTTLPPGTIVQPTGAISGGWWQIDWNGNLGWVYSRYLAPT